jgi:7,8-dihydropterin-6-yl-methyl-4-(beta-D-ribofuranosyl)aminobenzene 5'-phosphate synthase
MNSLTIICDNNSKNPALETSWGFSCLIEGFKNKILFDTNSNGELLLKNMHLLGVIPEDIKTVVLSHHHWDHTNGLSVFLSKNPDVSVYIPESFPSEIKANIKKLGSNYIEVSEPLEIMKDIYTTGELKSEVNEQSLILKTEKGITLLVGCAHPGITNVIKQVQERFKKEIYMIIGGFHLYKKDDYSIKEIVNQIKTLGVRKVAPCHCTGTKAKDYLKFVYGKDYIDIGCSSKILI